MAPLARLWYDYRVHKHLLTVGPNMQVETTTTQLEAIRQFINEKISPGVQAHGGEVTLQSLEAGVLTIHLSGACGTCGVLSYTSESVANYILEEFPDLDDVVVKLQGD